MRRAVVLAALFLGACASPSGLSPLQSRSGEPDASAALTGTSAWELVEDTDLFPGYINVLASNGRELVGGGIGCTTSGTCRPAIWTSPDGVEWARSPSFPAGESETLVTALGYGPEGWAAFADGFAWSSTDGQVWEGANRRDAFDGLTDGGPTYPAEGGCCWTTVTGVTHVDGAYVAVGAVTCHQCLGRAAVWRSDDLAGWERLPYTTAFEGLPLSAVAALPNGRLVAVGLGGVLVSDDLGVTWEASTPFGDGYATELAIAGDELVAAGFPGDAYEGAYWQSPDGLGWDPLAVEFPLPEAIPRRLGSAGGYLFLAGSTRKPGASVDTGFTAVSVNGLTWSQIPFKESADVLIWAFAEVDGLIVAAGNFTGEQQKPAAVWVLRQ